MPPSWFFRVPQLCCLLQTWAPGQGEEPVPPGVDAEAPGPGPDPLWCPWAPGRRGCYGPHAAGPGSALPGKSPQVYRLCQWRKPLIARRNASSQKASSTASGAPSWRSSSVTWGRGSGLSALPLPLPWPCPLPCPCAASAPDLGFAPTPCPHPSCHPGPGPV